MNRRRLRPLVPSLGIVLTCLASAGCAEHFGAAPAPPRSTPPAPPPREAPAPPRGGPLEGGPLEGRQLPGGVPEGPSALEAVHFAHDSSALAADARDTLQDHARVLMATPTGPALRIEGHCDDTGTNEYNLALGERRARAVRDYLVALGVDPERLATTSFGEELPAELGRDERSRALNRRAELRPVIGSTAGAPAQSAAEAPTARKSAPAGRW